MLSNNVLVHLFSLFLLIQLYKILHIVISELIIVTHLSSYANEDFIKSSPGISCPFLILFLFLKGKDILSLDLLLSDSILSGMIRFFFSQHLILFDNILFDYII